MAKKLLPWLPALFWMGIIFYFSGRSGEKLKSFFPFMENLNLNWGHLPAYFILALFIYFALARTTSLGCLPLWTVLLCLLYGVSDELHQSFVVSRTADIRDIATDAAGAVLAAAAARIYHRKRTLMDNINNNMD